MISSPLRVSYEERCPCAREDFVPWFCMCIYRHTSIHTETCGCPHAFMREHISTYVHIHANLHTHIYAYIQRPVVAPTLLFVRIFRATWSNSRNSRRSSDRISCSSVCIAKYVCVSKHMYVAWSNSRSSRRGCVRIPEYVYTYVYVYTHEWSNCSRNACRK